MYGWIRASRIIATFVLAFMIWNEFATNSMVGNMDAEAAGEPARQTNVTVRGGPRPVDQQGPDLLLVQARPQKSPTPTPPPAAPPATVKPQSSPTPTLQDLGVFKVTAYSDSALLNGTDGRGITRTGDKTHWGVVAVDPRIVPLGSHLKIDGMGDTVFTALDTGGGIIGRWVDVWYHSDDEALQHGVQFLTIRLLPE